MGPERNDPKVLENTRDQPESKTAFPAIKRPKKQSHFFRPVNNITGEFPVQPQQQQEHETSKVKPISQNTLHSRISPVREINLPRDVTNSPTFGRNRGAALHVATDRSDDSFDGILWKESPEFKTGNSTNNVANHGHKSSKSRATKLSSPLKGPEAKLETKTAPLTPEILSKYGSNFYNKSLRSPRLLPKTYSDLSHVESSSKNSIQYPNLKRAHSGNLSSLAANDLLEQSSLSGWMNKLDTGQAQPEVATSINGLKSSPSVSHLHCETLSDPFSDDEEVLELLTNQHQNHRQSQSFHHHRKEADLVNLEARGALDCSSPTTRAVTDKHDASDDPFSDEEDEEDPTSSGNLLQIPLTYSKFTKSFKQGILNLEEENSETGKTFHEEEEAITDIAYGRPNLRRLKITQIVLQQYGQEKRQQYIFQVESANVKNSTIIVRGEYCELEFQVGDIIHVIITDESHPNLVDDNHNLLVWNPDVLLSATTIAQQINCPRKSVILSRLKFPGTSTLPIIVGEIIHFIFQECMMTETWNFEFMNEIFESLIGQYLMSILCLDITVEDVRSEVSKHYEYLQTWFDKYYKKAIGPSSKIDNSSERELIGFAVDEILDIEEEIKSPVFGVKGKIDATIVAKLLNSKVKGKFLLPLEIKTGREYTSHGAQATLYALLFKDRYDLDIRSSILVYTKEQLTKRCNINVQDLRALLNLRNKVSQHFKSNQTYPPLLKRSDCERCDVQDACMVIHHSLEDGIGADGAAGIGEDVYAALTAGVSKDSYKQYLKSWDKLIGREEEFSMKAIKLLWTSPSQTRQSLGGCFDNLKIVESTDEDNSGFINPTVRGDKSQARRFTYTFAKCADDDDDTVGNFTSPSKFNVNDRVIISDVAGHFAIASGTVKSITPTRITVSTRRRVVTHDAKLADFNEKNNQVMKSLVRGSITTTNRNSKEKRFILDKDEMFYGLGLARYNVLSLFLSDSAPGLREFVVDLKAPTFQEHSKGDIHIEASTGFNSTQLTAYKKVFAANDYSLILGMPGTGKSTLIVEIIKRIVSEKKTVLLTSYTNSAVDNILLKLLENKNDSHKVVNFIRIGHPSRVHKSLHAYIPDYGDSIESLSQLSDVYNLPNVVAATCLSIRDPCFSIRTEFDYCIIDEASQITLPISLGPIQLAKKFVLVGDHYQLPPLVLHPDPEVKRGLGQSLFKVLANAHSDAVSELTHQYRMCEEIMQLSNILVYDNKLKCGNKETANQSLKIPRPESISMYAKPDLPLEHQWMNWVLDEEMKVLFLDHDSLDDASETVCGEAISNHTEAQLVKQIVGALITCGVEEKQIGVMSFYRAQLNLLKRDLSTKLDLEILTADQYQGRDKQCVVISLVRSNDEKKAGDLLKEWRRLNVAVTRAKSKLIILGSRSTLSTTNTTKTFIDFVDSKNRYFLLPKGADSMYDLPQSARSSPFKGPNQKRLQHLTNTTPILKNIIDDIQG
ncbi:uncharacterized protein LODBEIA_P00930 [Lodderomyces beijingensis]|uniref:DNA helicase n=1 Tax=Lodderomyces beijingensis TaxID=1775926 RepID=A0ABP0ZD99_9ASCO